MITHTCRECYYTTKLDCSLRYDSSPYLSGPYLEDWDLTDNVCGNEDCGLEFSYQEVLEDAIPE